MILSLINNTIKYQENMQEIALKKLENEVKILDELIKIKETIISK